MTWTARNCSSQHLQRCAVISTPQHYVAKLLQALQSDKLKLVRWKQCFVEFTPLNLQAWMSGKFGCKCQTDRRQKETPFTAAVATTSLSADQSNQSAVYV